MAGLDTLFRFESERQNPTSMTVQMQTLLCDTIFPCLFSLHVLRLCADECNGSGLRILFIPQRSLVHLLIKAKKFQRFLLFNTLTHTNHACCCWCCGLFHTVCVMHMFDLSIHSDAVPFKCFSHWTLSASKKLTSTSKFYCQYQF